MRGEVGVCLQGTHPDQVEKTERDSNLAKTIHSSVIKYEVYFLLLDSHPEFQPDGIELLTQADINEKHTSYRIKTTVVESLTGGKSDWETILEQKSLHTVEGVVVVHVVQSGTVIRSTEEGQELNMIQENLGSYSGSYHILGSHLYQTYCVETSFKPLGRSTLFNILKVCMDS